MGVFKDANHLQDVIGGFFELLAVTDSIAPKLLSTKLILKFIYKEPELTITIDLSGPKTVITFNDSEKKPTIEMTMKADIAHKFWMGDLNLVMALARREMVAKGPVPKILQILPIIKPAYKLYPEYIKTKGL